MTKNNKLLLSLLCVCIVVSLMASFMISTMAADNIASTSPVKVSAFDSGLEGRSARQITGDYGIRMHYGAPFNGVSVSMPTWSDTTSSATLSLYKWDTSYDKTIASTPIATQTFNPLKDNAYNALTFDEQPAGEYFLRIHDVSGGRVGVWHMTKKVSNGYCYDAGMETEADWEMKVNFTQTPKEPFLAVESALNAGGNSDKTPDEYVPPEDSLLNTHKVMPDTWVFTDGLGRESLTYEDVGGVKEDKTLAMFYWTWHTKDTASQGYVNTTELMKLYPEAKNDYNHAAWTGTGRYCFWNEPIYGFYTTEDPWVLRRQAELLANAGVDAIFTDNTNGAITWRSSYLKLYETWNDAQQNGAVDVPKVSYMMPFWDESSTNQQVKTIYNDIYRTNRYQNLWFYWEGKPMLMARQSSFSTDVALEAEISDYFTWRGGQAEYLLKSATKEGQWGWLSTYPQAVYYKDRDDRKAGVVEQMTVGVAVNHNYVTHEISAMNGYNVMGRSYTSDYQDRYAKEGESASLWGYQFSEQFDYALEMDPKVLFVTGWNEWHAWRQPSPWGGANSQVNNALVDQFDNEHSRDLEPTKGELKDHYYYLFVNYARQFKGVNPIPTPSNAVVIDMNAGSAQWEKVEPYYAAYIGNTDDRNCTGYGKLVYTETSGRNDLIGAQIARDDDYVYFHVECAENITPYTDSLWMTLYIDSNQENQGWETFEYVVNKSAASAETVVLEKFTGNGYESTKVADCAYTVDGRYMTVKIAKSDLGLTGYDFTINFSWTDNVHDEGDYSKFSGDIMDFYISGDVAPGARFKYSYISTTENAGGLETLPEETQPDAVDTTEDNQDETDVDTQETGTETGVDSSADAADTADTTDATEANGCASALSISASLTCLALMGMVVFACKKKED